MGPGKRNPVETHKSGKRLALGRPFQLRDASLKRVPISALLIDQSISFHFIPASKTDRSPAVPHQAHQPPESVVEETCSVDGEERENQRKRGRSWDWPRKMIE
jgi:hypothetical protein